MFPLKTKTILLKKKIKIKLINKIENHLYIQIKSPLNSINYRIDLKKNKVLFKKDRIIFFESSWSLDRLLISQHMKGVLRGFKKKIEVFGMGYKVNFDESTNSFILFIGYSHSIKYKIPSNVFVKILKKNQVSLSSVNYQALMQTIATLKSFKKVDVYKGKGIKLQGEKLVLKEGKKSKK